MEFTARQVRAMGLIADTFATGRDGVPAPTEVGAHELALQIAAANPRTGEVRQLRALLDAWDSRALGLALTGRPRRFSELDQAARERMLLSLSDSRVGAKRVLFQGLKTASLLPYYMTGGAALWDGLGYPGPLGVHPDPPAPAIRPLPLTHDTALSCDVVVVGSGAGGGTAAGVLAAAGLDVVVLEAGGMHDERHFDGGEETGFLQLYALSPQSTAEGQVALLAGRGLGGGTVVNYTTSFRTPDRVREEWAGHGVPQFATAEYAASMDAVCARLGVNTDHDRAAPRDAILERGARALGWDVAAMPRNVAGCDQDVECGRCGMGCRLGAKQSTAKTWLEDAAHAGARICTGVTVRTVTTSFGRATGVEGVTADGHRVQVRARAVVVAAGAIQTPALLQRSGLTNPHIGRHLRLHPATAVWGRMEEPVDGWVGAMQSRYVDALTDLDGDGYGVLFETAPLTPAFGTGFVNWRGADDFRRRMTELRHTLGVAVIVRDRDPGGTVQVDRRGEPVVRYRLSARDTDHLVQGLVGGARIAEAAGARWIASTHHRTVSYEPGVRGSAATFEQDLRSAGATPATLALAALHIMGTARMGGSRDSSAVDPDGRTWDVEGLYVADGSCFPTASGVNPMISIESIAHMTATRLAARMD
ncbi:GMC family oxidoreductase [Nocardioides daeguensis]|uniref:GMC family oxidoreductase n=1 Tax=Nocardioides daeguensis TaxID=908359 RepID=A0ABP6W120_9ACTN|nr:GMC family oxidoreductase [Nocardioides daeguensis]MBV6726739.1 GMC family oxidoreductase N-terminal domain-containing protein [Nocardioides daeguensis]MCR1774509.1 GMC family oxidoreductase N-terminal domain-containing protein [Nocardioides daeguensis]